MGDVQFTLFTVNQYRLLYTYTFNKNKKLRQVLDFHFWFVFVVGHDIPCGEQLML